MFKAIAVPPPKTTQQYIAMSRNIYLIKSRNSSRMRAHFGILIPNTDTCTQDLHLHTTDPETPPFLGTVIHVIGAPMAGFHLEFKRNFDANRDQELKEVILVGSINGIHVADPPFTNFSREDKPICTVEAVATQIPPPRKSENFLAPVNDVSSALSHSKLLFTLYEGNKQEVPGVDDGFCSTTGGT